jgi:hypothetical protein
MTDRLRPLWDFDDLERTQQRLRTQLERETSNAGRAEVLTQLARIESLRDEFDACEELLEVRKRDPNNPQAIEWAEEALDETRKALGR